MLGLYRGVGSAVIRTGAGSSVQLPTYFLAKRQIEKHKLLEEGPLKHVAASTVSGLCVCIVMHPPGTLRTCFSLLNPSPLAHMNIKLMEMGGHFVDTVMSRMYNQNGNLYTGLVDCLVKTIRSEGVLAVYKVRYFFSPSYSLKDIH